MRYQAIVKTARVAALVTLVELLVLVNGVDVICEKFFMLGFIAALLAYMLPLKATPVQTFLWSVILSPRLVVKGHFSHTINLSGHGSVLKRRRNSNES